MNIYKLAIFNNNINKIKINFMLINNNFFFGKNIFKEIYSVNIHIIIFSEK